MTAVFRYTPYDTVRLRFRVSRYGSGVRIVILGQTCRRTYDACDVTERGLYHVSVFGLQPLHQLVAHLVHERWFLVSTSGFLERELAPVQCCMAVVAERHQVVPVICSTVLALDELGLITCFQSTGCLATYSEFAPWVW